VSFAILASCSAFDASLIEPGELDAGSPDEVDAGSFDAGAVEPVDAGPVIPLGLRKPPPRPTNGDPGGEMELTMAMRDVVLNQDGDRWRDIGLDLDDLDSQPPVPDVECVPPDTDAEPILDGDDGIDNAFGDELYPIVRLALPNLEEQARANQELGLGTILVRIRGWNGTANDPRVDAYISQAAAGTPADPESVRFEGFDLVNVDDGLPAPLPAWDGSDNWFARDDTFFMGMEDTPVIRDDNAYVVERTVVARLPDRIDILFFAGADAGVRVRLTDGWTFATFNEDFTETEIATVAGRWAILDLLETGDNIGICTGSAERRIVENQLDAVADVRSRPGTGGPGVPCDAVSLGVTFRGVVSHWGGLGPSLPLPDPCDGADADAGPGDPDAGT